MRQKNLQNLRGKFLHSHKQQRIAFLLLLFLLSGLIFGLVLKALNANIVFFLTPTDFHQTPPQIGQPIRLGGLVVEGSVTQSGTQYRFKITDGNAQIEILYDGIVPDLFREGQGIIAEGDYDGAPPFRAKNILAKHDENYIPRELAETLKQQDYWQDDSGKAKP